MIAATYLLVLALVYPNGQEAWEVLDSGLSARDCRIALEVAPMPFAVAGTVINFRCVLEQGD